MNVYKLSEIQVGMKESFKVIVTQKMMEDFFTTTGDCNPMHIERGFANQGGIRIL